MKNSTLHLLVAALTAVCALIAAFATKSPAESIGLCLISGQQLILSKLSRWEELVVEIVTALKKGLSGNDTN